jgi:general L-amino acid transport system permease protein
VSKNGLSYPSPVWGPGQTLAAGALVGVVASVLVRAQRRRQFDRTGKPAGRCSGVAGAAWAAR